MHTAWQHYLYLWINPLQAQILKTPESDEYYFEEGCFILESSNTAQDPQLSIARVRLSMSTRLHRLSNLVERYVILSGSVEVADLSTQTVNVGNVVVIPSFCVQKITNTGETI